MKAHLTRFYFRIRYSIGYYPTLIGMAYFAFAMIVVALPGSDLWRPLRPFLVSVELPRVHNAEVVLPALITGIISFITLSFAMVMVVLSNVSTTFSPKLLLGLVTERKHQVVLGNYIGAIIYCLILLLTISDGDDHRFRNLAVILAAAMAIWCLVLFVYFIHNISTSVQIGTIIEKIYNDTRKELSRREKAEKGIVRSRQAHIDYLTDLCVMWIKLRHSAVHYDENQNPRLVVRDLGFENLYTMCIGPIHRYGKKDLLIAAKLLHSFKVLSHFDRRENRYKGFLNGLALSVVEDIEKSSTNHNDLAVIHERVREMNDDPDEYFKLPHGNGSV